MATWLPCSGGRRESFSDCSANSTAVLASSFSSMAPGGEDWVRVAWTAMAEGEGGLVSL